MEIHEETYKGYTIKVGYDYEAEYGDCDHMGMFYTNIPRVLNPDNIMIDEAFENGALGSLEEQRRIKDELIYVDVYAYIHGGIALSTCRRGQFADQWDSGWAGVMACTMDEARKWLGENCDVEEIEKRLEQEVEELNCYCTGQVYGFSIVEDGYIIESYGGYVGDCDECIEEAKSFIDNIKIYERQSAF